jgi:hypothetical protein
MTDQRHDDRSVATAYKPVTRRSTRRRRTKTPVRFMASAPVAGPNLVRGTSLRMTYLLGSIRVHQSGGFPIHAASTRHPSHQRSPPHEHGGSDLIGVKAVRPRAYALRALRLDPRDAATVKHGRGEPIAP